MKNNFKPSVFILTLMASASFFAFSSCQKPAERPAVIDEKIADNNFVIQKMNEQDKTAEAIQAQQAVINKCLSLMKDENQKKILIEASQQNRLSIKMEEGKLSFMIKKQISENSPTNDQEINSKEKIEAEKVFTFKITTGILENERTEYNEKKHILDISPKLLSESTIFTINEQIIDLTSTVL